MKLGSKLLLSALLSTLVIWPLFLAQPQLAPVLKDPTNKIFIEGGDAWKNIYTVAFHVVHDEGFIETQAFNYPDGEHIAFADGQPLLSAILKILRVEKVETVFAVVQLLPFFGCILGAVLLTWLLLRFRLPLLYAILFGIGIALLSPQLTRSTGHFGLSYVFAIPLILHLLLNWVKTRSWNSIAWLIIASVGLGQLHLYLLASALLLSCSFMFLTQLLTWKGSDLRVFAQIMVLGVVSFGISKGIVDLTWPIADRPAAPYGLKAFTSAWEDMLIDRELPWWKWINEHVTKIRKPGGFEGKGYVGIVASLFSIYLLLKYVLLLPIKLFKRNDSSTLTFDVVGDEDTRKVLVVLSLVFLLSFVIASGILFVIPGIEITLDELGAIRQFRSVGRFIWIGYYAIQIVVSIVVSNWFILKSKYYKESGDRLRSIVAYVIPLLIASLLIWEGNTAIYNINASPTGHKYNVEKWSSPIGDVSKYQAILPLPYFHVGSENFNALAKYTYPEASTLLSLHLGLPNMGVMMSRQSISLSIERLGLNMPWVKIPKVLSKLNPEKPIIILGHRSAMIENIAVNSTHDFIPWFKESDTLYIDEDVILLEFLPSYEKLNKVLQNYCEYWSENSTSIVDLQQRVSTNMVSQFGWDLGKDIFSIQHMGFTQLHTWQRPRGIDSMPRERLKVSWLAFVGEDGYVSNTYELRIIDHSTGVSSVVESVSPLMSTNQYVGDWAQLSVEVPADIKGEELSIWAKMARHPNVRDVTIRNVVSVPADSSVLWKTTDGYMKDGLLLRACN